LQHDAVLDYYGRRLATCSSDRSIKIFEVENDKHVLSETLKGHDGAVWCVSWAHPKFGTLLASSSFDGRILIWREQPAGQWTKIHDFAQHSASVNLVAWAPHEAGCILAGASSDGQVSVLEFRENTWVPTIFPAHAMGANAVSWAPSVAPGAVTSASGTQTQPLKRFVTGGSDCLVKIWDYSQENQGYSCMAELPGHSDWVRDVAWAPTILSKSYIASASQDKSVKIWTTSSPNPSAGTYLKLPTKAPICFGGSTWLGNALLTFDLGDWTPTTLSFDAVAWRVSWSLSGNVLAVSTGDNKVSLWKERLAGGWENVKTIEE
jgi:protein transport protein SEC13